MSSEDTLLGSAFKAQVGDGGSPEDFSDACSIVDIQNLGESKSQVETTAYCDDARTYISGLREGNEVSLVCNYIQGANDIAKMFQSWDAGTNRTLRFAKKGALDSVYLEFGGALLSWGLQPPVDGRMQLTFAVKISGLITRVGFDG